MTCRCPLPEHLNPPEERDECERCGSRKETVSVTLTAEECSALNSSRIAGLEDVSPGLGACLCEDCDEERRNSWNEDSQLLLSVLQALGTAAGVDDTEIHPNLLATKIAAKLPYHPTNNPGGVQP